jgi:hypothetical protein
MVQLISDWVTLLRAGGPESELYKQIFGSIRGEGILAANQLMSMTTNYQKPPLSSTQTSRTSFACVIRKGGMVGYLITCQPSLFSFPNL